MPLRINGATSGYVQLAAPNAAGSTALVLPTDSVQPGLVLVATSSFTAASTVSVDGCFTSAYDNYRVLIRQTSSIDSVDQYVRMRASGSDASGANYTTQVLRYDNATATAARATGDTGMRYGRAHSGDSVTALDMFGPALAVATFLQSHNTIVAATPQIEWRSSTHTLTTAYDGMTIYPSSGTITGTLRVYGYRNSITT